MTYSLLDNLSDLPEDEISRLQMKLGIILKNHSQKHSIQKTLKNLYIRKGNPIHYLNKKHPVGEQFILKLMDSYCILPADKMQPEEKEFFQNNPYTVWPNPATCMLSEEALEFFSDAPELPRNYLLFYINDLGPREKTSWMKWIGLDQVTDSDIRKNRNLFFHLIQLNSQQPDLTARDIPEHLEDVFPDDPSLYPAAWFYRGVLPLYDSLQKTESSAKLSDLQKYILNLIRFGKVLVVREKAEFGKLSQHRLVLSREKLPDRHVQEIIPAPASTNAAVDKKEQQLF